MIPPLSILSYCINHSITKSTGGHPQLKQNKNPYKLILTKIIAIEQVFNQKYENALISNMTSIPHITLTKQIAFSSNVVILSFDVVLSLYILHF